MEQHMVLVHLDGGVDHREHPGIACQRYFVQREGQPSVMADQLAALDPDARRDVELRVGSRTIEARGMGRKVLWCDYAALCEAPLAALDFIALCDRFDVLMLGQVPALAGCAQPARIARGTEDASEQVQAGDRQLPPLSPKDDGVRRFIALVDECYDRGVPLVIEAQVPMDELYPDGHLAFAFRRTLSRLSEMQLERFGRG
ncbi:cell division protein ZapE [Halomonas binhaiensis]|uniref:cell division protein ZapE n=1 Tax=Halomonas binhaiensis TaxID=2562282 RepID=UPI0023DD86FD|nr:cell division protein ZapE [Halomonas binhaiensis]